MAATQPFFITGLPCSRTAWLANVFTTGPVFCHHDLLGQVKDMKHFRRLLEEDGWGQPARGPQGDSDSGLLAGYSRVNEMFPAARWVLVDRDFEEAWESLCAFMGSGPWKDALACSWELHEEMRAEWPKVKSALMGNPRVMHVPFAALERTDMIETVWKHCVPGQRFDRRRAEALQRLRVQPCQGKGAVKPRLSLLRELYPVT